MGTVAVVTGAGGGIGSAVACRLARAGADVCLVDRDFGFTADWGGHTSARSVVDQIEAVGRRAIVAEGDAADREFAQRVVDQTVDTFGAVDILVNSAGGALSPHAESFAATSSDLDLELLFRANYRSTVTFSQASVAHMKRRGSGAIINITSGTGIEHLAVRDGSIAHYLASKAAVTSYTTSLANEVGQHGIRVNAISPGFVLSPRAAAFILSPSQRDKTDRISLRRFGEPDDIAKAVEFFASDLASYVTGQVLAVTGG